jgi:hypothetical protein
MNMVPEVPTLLAEALMCPFSNEEFKLRRRVNFVVSHIVSEARRPLPDIQSKTLTAVYASADTAMRKATVRNPLCFNLGKIEHL